MKDRTRRLEEKMGVDKSKPCPKCGRHIPYVLRDFDGEVSYPFGEPCGSCEGPPVIRVIEEMTGDNDKD